VPPQEVLEDEDTTSIALRIQTLPVRQVEYNNNINSAAELHPSAE